MPRPATQLTIAQPCPESWAAMTPAGPGRHCAACQKTVVDFTQHSDTEILAFFRQTGQDKPCGRFRADQLGRPLHPAPRAARPPYWQRWLAGVLAALTVQSCQTTTGEVQPAALRHLAPPPVEVSIVDSTTIGDIDTLLYDSAVVSISPPLPNGETIEQHVLGEPEM